MIDRFKRIKVGPRQAGFTLIELLVVITILGILAAIVVFSVGGITDKGATSACKTDLTTLQTAEEANVAKGAPSGTPAIPNGQYVSEDDLVSAGLLNSVSSLHNIVLTPAAGGPGDTYAIVPVTGIANACTA